MWCAKKIRIQSLARLILAACAPLIALLSGCQPAEALKPRPTPRVLAVNITPALSPLRQQANQCADELGNAGLVLNELPAYVDEPPAAALTLRWGPGVQASAGFAAVVGQDILVVIAHPANTLDEISLTDLRGLYSGALRSWPGSEPPAVVQPWVYPDGDDVQLIFEKAVMGSETASPRVVYPAPDPAAMLEAVAGSPAAVGFVPRRWLENMGTGESAVKSISITGLSEEALRHPVLASSSTEPPGEPTDFEKSWLICLQEQLSE